MPYVITRSCCNDASCVAACPVNCIHPTPDEPDFATAEMLYIDPEVCIDCGACVPECPVEAIVADLDLTASDGPYAELNARYYLDPAHRDYPDAQYDASRPLVNVKDREPLRVAIVGSGPAGAYAAEELVSRRGLNAEVHVFERLPVPWGLVRFGVAPDHQDTKRVTRQFARTASRDSVTFNLNVEVGEQVTHDELLTHFHAVIYAVGARSDRRLNIPGEDLAGVHSATDFVAWYNGHPDFADASFDLSGERAVVIGNGNVALDVARILASDIDRLGRTDIADHALAALAESSVKEIVVLGRRGPAHAAFTTPELIALSQREDFGLDVDFGGFVNEPGGFALPEYKIGVLHQLAQRPVSRHERTVRLRFLRSPVGVVGPSKVHALHVVHNELDLAPDGSTVVRATAVEEEVECGLVLRSIGYRGTPLPGLPFDHERGTLPNAGGRVLDKDGEALEGVYATGWIKRGASGVIGTNKACAADTVQAIVDDYLEGRLPAPRADTSVLESIIDSRRSGRMAYHDWLSIDRHEIGSGNEAGRPRRKLVHIDEMLAIGTQGG